MTLFGGVANCAFVPNDKSANTPSPVAWEGDSVVLTPIRAPLFSPAQVAIGKNGRRYRLPARREGGSAVREPELGWSESLGGYN